MRKTTLLLSLLLAGAAGSALAADKVTVQLKWLPQAQFAGYYVAAAKGFYKEADLDVTIKPGGPTSRPPRCWLPRAPTSPSTGCPALWRHAKPVYRWSTWRRSSTAPG